MSKKAHTVTTTHDDGSFERTALMVEGSEAGSVAIVNAAGERLALLNIFVDGDSLIVDTIDVDNRYATKRALGFGGGKREIVKVPDGKGALVSADFRKSGGT